MARRAGLVGAGNNIVRLLPSSETRASTLGETTRTEKRMNTVKILTLTKFQHWGFVVSLIPA